VLALSSALIWPSAVNVPAHHIRYPCAKYMWMRVRSKLNNQRMCCAVGIRWSKVEHPALDLAFYAIDRGLQDA
jgi:hypothetical protein